MEFDECDPNMIKYHPTVHSRLKWRENWQDSDGCVKTLPDIPEGVFEV